MPTMDIFRNDAFSLASLTDAFIKKPYQPGRIGALGLFRSRGVTTTSIQIESKDGQLALIETTPRGGPGGTVGTAKRTLRSFIAPHLERNATIVADSIQNVRAFGSENELEGVQAVIDDRMGELRPMHEVTLEYHRVGAIQGVILDADGSTPIYNLFTEFGISQQTYEIDLGADDVRSQVVAIQRLSESELGAEIVTGYRAFCGDHFFDELIECDAVKESLKYQESRTLREDLRQGFTFAGVTWENYRGRVGSVDFFPAGAAYVVPLGTTIFTTYFAPADFLETVNTIGLPVYAKIATDPEFQRWAKLHTQSNPLCINLRPRAVIKVTFTS